jgi:hypothetical protein
LQVSSGAQFRIVDDGKTLTISLIESNVLREFTGKLARHSEEEDSKSFTGTVNAVFRPDALKPHFVHVSAKIDDSDHLRLRCTDWPILNNAGRKMGTKVLNEMWTRSNRTSARHGLLDNPFTP